MVAGPVVVVRVLLPTLPRRPHEDPQQSWPPTHTQQLPPESPRGVRHLIRGHLCVGGRHGRSAHDGLHDSPHRRLRPPSRRLAPCRHREDLARSWGMGWAASSGCDAAQRESRSKGRASSWNAGRFFPKLWSEPVGIAQHRPKSDPIWPKSGRRTRANLAQRLDTFDQKRTFGPGISQSSIDCYLWHTRTSTKGSVPCRPLCFALHTQIRCSSRPSRNAKAFRSGLLASSTRRNGLVR